MEDEASQGLIDGYVLHSYVLYPPSEDAQPPIKQEPDTEGEQEQDGLQPPDPQRVCSFELQGFHEGEGLDRTYTL